MQSAPSSTGILSSTLHRGRFRAYFEILIVGSGARLFGMASQFVVLLILSRVLFKAQAPEGPLHEFPKGA